MLFAHTLRQNTKFIYTEGQGDPPLILLHNAALTGNHAQPTSLWISKDGQSYLIASLTPKNPHCSLKLRLFIEDSSQLFVRGPGAIHVIGSYDDPHMLDRLGLGQNPNDEGSDVEDQEQISDQEQEIVPVVKKNNQKHQKKQAIEQKKIVSSPPIVSRKQFTINSPISEHVKKAFSSNITEEQIQVKLAKLKGKAQRARKAQEEQRVRKAQEAQKSKKAERAEEALKALKAQKAQPLNDPFDDNEDDDGSLDDLFADEDEEDDEEDDIDLDDDIEDLPTKYKKLGNQKSPQGGKPQTQPHNKGRFGNNQSKPNQQFNKGPGNQNKGGFQGNNQGGNKLNKGKPFHKQ